jgi:CRP/FNR family transcriptional regulator, cyclic AMP receptor protein
VFYALRVARAPADLIERIPLFSGLDKGELKAIGASLNERTFDAGSAVVEEGRMGVGFFVVDAGTAAVSVDGREVRTLGPGDYFGEIALIAGTERTATITAETDLHCYGITAWDFRAMVESNPSIAWKLLQTLAQRLADAQPA